MSETKDWGKEAFVSFFFLGKAPVAPGTFGSLGALVLAYFAIENIEAFVGYLLLLLAAIMYYIGVQIAPWCEEKYGKEQVAAEVAEKRSQELLTKEKVAKTGE